MNDLAQALMIAIRAHSGGVDKQGDPYLLHILRVVEAVDSEKEKILAALHDVYEDSDFTFPDTEKIFGFGEDGILIANSLEVLTREDDETYNEYIQGIKDGYSATWADEIRKVKLADLRDNLGRIPPEPDPEIYSGLFLREWKEEWESLKQRYEKAIKIIEA